MGNISTYTPRLEYILQTVLHLTLTATVQLGNIFMHLKWFNKHDKSYAVSVLILTTTLWERIWSSERSYMSKHSVDKEVPVEFWTHGINYFLCGFSIVKHCKLLINWML